MGGVFSFLWGGTAEDPNLDIPDPATGLTLRHKRAVTTSWELVKQNLRQNGIDLLMAFFIEHPDYTQNFKAFKEISLENLPENKKFQAHANAVIYALTSIVDNLDNTEVLVEMLTKLGDNHGSRNIMEKEFNNLRTVVMKFLKDKLGSHFPPETEKAWEKTLDVAYSVIFIGIEKSRKSKHVIQ